LRITKICPLYNSGQYLYQANAAFAFSTIAAESGFVVHSQLGKNATVHFYASFLQTSIQPAVRKVVDT
jgi:hypothetical protein